MKIRFALAAAMVIVSSSAIADGIFNPRVSAAVWDDGINNSAGMSGGTTPPTSCAQTGLDFTDQCNAILYVVLF